MTNYEMNNEEKELIKTNHKIVDSLIEIVAHLALNNQIKKTGGAFFIHKNVKMEIDIGLIVAGIKFNLKDFMIEESGEKEGLDRCYNILNLLHITDGAGSRMLSKEGLGLIDALFTSVAEDFLLAQVNESLGNKTLH